MGTTCLANQEKMSLQDLLGGMGMGMGMGGMGAQATDGPVVDTSEMVYISSLPLLKMLKHGRAGVPMEVMGLMLGEFVDEYTVRVIDAFRTIAPQTVMLGQEPRQTTSSVGHPHKPSIQALVHGLNRSYYSIAISYRKNELEMDMLANLHKRRWLEGLSVVDFEKHSEANLETVERMVSLATKYNKDVQAEEGLSAEELAIAHVGKVDAKRHLDQAVDDLMAANIVQSLGTMLDSVVF